MSNFSGFKKGPQTSNSKKNHAKRGHSSASKPGAPKGGRSQGGRGNQQKKVIKSFDPSQFMLKKEEQKAQVEHIIEHSFNDFALFDQIKNNITQHGYSQPTPIQDQVIPYLLEKKDVVATANTGTGKTAAFLIPLIQNLLSHATRRVLIITPTRELALQIQGELRALAIKTGLEAAVCIGGLNISHQIRELKKVPAFVIGTPGRLLDLENSGSLDFAAFDTIVLDEVDTMLDMGFINDVTHIIRTLPKNRHSLFFSATISPAIKTIIDRFLHDPVFVSVKTRQTSANIKQEAIKVGSQHKIELLHDLLIKPEFKRTIIFCRTKRATDKMARVLQERGFALAAIHGDKTQQQRKKALDLFKKGTVNILLATDVVARGIDIDDVSHVINYDLPATQEDYVHRIGRTGRSDKMGHAITFID